MATVEQKLKPWLVPNFAVVESAARPRQEGFHTAQTVSLSELPAETLASMCDDFRAAVFAKAGKPDPAPPASTGGDTL